MLENYIRNLDMNTLKTFIKKQNITATDEELQYVLNVIKTNSVQLLDPNKRQAIINSLPPNIQQKVILLMQRYSL